MSKIYKSAAELIGGTPLIELRNIAKKFSIKARLLAKVEFFNPAGSVKDRVAKSIIDDAEKNGKLTSQSVIIEATSGNTGIGLASVGAARGYKVIIVMPDSMSVERIKLMRAYGAEVVLTEGSLGMAGAVKKAEELARELPNSLLAAQFENPANARAHYLTTGPEIYSDTDGEVDIFVAGVGTGGTVSGVGRYLKEKKSDVKIVAVEPLSSPLLSKGISGAHGIQGIGANFIPKVLDTEIYDEIITVTDSDAYKCGRYLGSLEGFTAGISSGAALSAAIEVASRPENENKTVVVLLADGGDRYLSTKMYE